MGTGSDCDVDGPDGWIEPGTTQICTVDLDDIGTQLVVRTVVDNSGGGPATPSDWLVTVTGTMSSASFAGSDAGVRFYPYQPFQVKISNSDGTDYTLDQPGTSSGDRGPEDAPWTCTFTFTDP